MFISDFAIKRPVFSVALSLLIIIVGLLSYMNLSIQQYPDVEEPVITVETRYGGAASTIIESKITTVLEEVFSGLSGLDYMESSSRSGQSQITLFFRGGTNLTDAAADVRERIARVSDSLPEDADDPRVSKSTANDDPFMTLVLTSPVHDELSLYDYVDRNLKGPFEAIPGVGGLQVWGNPITMQVLLDREKLKAHNVDVLDVKEKIEKNTQTLPSGNIIKGKRHVNITTEAGLNTPEAMGNLVISTEGGHVVHLRDVATIFLGKDTGEGQWIPKFNKKTAVFIGIRKVSGGNVLAISNSVLDRFSQIKETLPKGMHIEVGYNFSMFIDASINAVITTIFEAIVLVLLIILFFLHSPRAALIPLLTIPVSLIGSFAFLYAFNCSINTITLLAMVLAIGLVVDDAIVVLENIHRHIEEGLKPLEAAIKGAREVGFPVIAMTLTLASVYAPIAFVQGLTGKLFAEFAVSLAGSVLISGLVALTLSPMMCAKLLKEKEQESKNPISRWIESLIDSVEVGYKKALVRILEHPMILSSGLAIVFGSGVFIYTLLPSELAPQEDQGIVMSWTQGPEGATLESMAEYTSKVEDLLTSVTESDGLWSATLRSGIFSGITLKPWSERKRSQSEIIEELRKKARKIAGAQVFVFPMKGLLTGGQSGLQMAFKTTGSYDQLEADMDKLTKELKKNPCFESAKHDLFLGVPEIKLQIDRNKAALLGVNLKDVGETLKVMLSGDRSNDFEKEGKHYDIVIHTLEDYKKNLSDIGNFFVKSDTEEGFVPLNNIVNLKEIAVPGELKHVSKLRASILEGELKPSCRLEEGLKIVKSTAKDVLPPSVQMEPVGALRKFMESQGDIYVIFFASLLFIYLVLAIQFESLLDPLLIMFTVPLSMSGALLALYLTGNSLNIFSQVGLITLVGLITKHGILIVDFANKLREQGLTTTEAVLKAATLRLRPILMTTGAMVLGAVPLAFAMGAGAESRQQIGWVLVGGLLGGTLFTLFAVPFVYKVFKGRRT